MTSVLAVAAEVYPLVKTGGLADVVGGVLVTWRRHWNRAFLQYFLALGAVVGDETAGDRRAHTHERELPEADLTRPTRQDHE